MFSTFFTCEVRFELTFLINRKPVFKTGALDRSATRTEVA